MKEKVATIVGRSTASGLKAVWERMMKATRLEIYWQNELVGFMVHPSVDNFHLYGQWVAAEGEALNDFQSALSRAAAEEPETVVGVTVTLGKGSRSLTGEATVQDGEINVLCHPP
jgi:hypothetical protein